MNTTHYFKLGMFVLIGAGMLLGTVLALGAGRLLRKQIPAETLMDESVSGLDMGSPVKYRGVTIGRVTSIAFAADKNGGVEPQTNRIARYVLIDMSLDASSFKGMSLPEINQTLKRMAHNGLRARVEQQGIGGSVYLGLDFLDPASIPPPEIRWKSATLYIPSAPSAMTQVMSAAERLASDLRRANLPEVVEHIDGLIVNATGAVQHVNQIVEANRGGLKSAVADLPAITSHLKTTTARVDEILHDKRLNQAIGNVADDSASAGATLGDVHRTVQNLQTLIASEQADIQTIVGDLRRTADNLAAVSSELRDNPSRLLLGGPPPRKELGE